jgi:hypothetical protein
MSKRGAFLIESGLMIVNNLIFFFHLVDFFSAVQKYSGLEVRGYARSHGSWNRKLWSNGSVLWRD